MDDQPGAGGVRDQALTAPFGSMASAVVVAPATNPAATPRSARQLGVGPCRGIQARRSPRSNQSTAPIGHGFGLPRKTGRGCDANITRRLFPAGFPGPEIHSGSASRPLHSHRRAAKAIGRRGRAGNGLAPGSHGRRPWVYDVLTLRQATRLDQTAACLGEPAAATPPKVASGQRLYPKLPTLSTSNSIQRTTRHANRDHSAADPLGRRFRPAALT